MLQARTNFALRPFKRGLGYALVILATPAAAQDGQQPATPPPPTSAGAEQDLRPITVLERQAERERRRGVDLAGVRVLPTVTVRLGYDSNVFAAPNGQSDASVTLGGAVVGELETGRGVAHVRADLDRLQYARFTSENATQWSIGADGALDLPAALKLRADVDYAHRVEPRTSSGAPVAAGRPVRYRTTTGDVDLEWQGARLRAGIGGRLADFDYRDVRLGAVTLDQQARDYRYAELHGRLGYEVDGQRQLFALVDRHWGDYRLPQAATGANRDTRGWQATVGIASAITPLVRGTASIGYLRESFALAAARPVSALAFNAALDWLVTPITTVHFDASRRLENGVSLDATGYLATRLAVRIDHELTRNTLLDLSFSQDSAAFRSIDRDDTVYGIALGARHQLSSELFARVRGTYQWRSSGGAAQGFDFAKALVSLDVGYAF